ncbi:MAG: ribosome maturation factor RimM [Crocinitomicaceae bacterium]|nr:ribosome maturation factor RimM [Crocinitomicaceae bacterium]
MNKADCFHLGYIAKLHGFKGEVSLFLDVTNPEDYRTLDALFIELNGQLTPFFITSIKLKNKGFASIKLEGIDSEDDARILLRKNVYLPASILPELGDKNFYDHEIVNFQVEDSNHGNIGKVIQVIDLAANPLIQIDKDGKELLLPLQEGVIQKVDRKNNKLFVTAPPGLVELYLN